MINAGDAATLVGALGLGSVLGAFVTGARDRRSARAAVLEHFRAIELERWAPTDWHELRRHTTALTAGALVAQLPRQVVTEYMALAHVAARMSQDNYDKDPKFEYANGIDGEVAELVEAAAHLIVTVAWSARVLAPLRAANGLRHMRQLEARIDRRGFVDEVESARHRAS